MRIATLGNAAVGHTTTWVSWFRSRGHDVRLFSLQAPPEGFADCVRLPSSSLPGALRYPLAVPAPPAEDREADPEPVRASRDKVG